MGSETAVPLISLRVIVSCLLWYSTSSITSQLTKVILTRFTYPLFLSQCQFFIGAGFAFTLITITRNVPNLATVFPPGSVPNDHSSPIFSLSLLLKISPLGLFQFVGKFFSLSATSMIPLATVSSVKALSPLLIVLGYRIFYNVRFSLTTYLSLTPLVGGVLLIIASDSVKGPLDILITENNELDIVKLRGLIYCLISTIIFATQNIYGKSLMTWNVSSFTPASSLVLHQDSATSSHVSNSAPRNRANSIRLPYSTSDLELSEKKSNPVQSEYKSQINKNKTIYNPFEFISSRLQLQETAKPDKLTIILYCSLIGLVFSASGFLVNELPQILNGDTDLDYQDFITVLVLIVLDSMSHFAQTILAFHLLGSLPALSYSIASMMKRIVLIAVSIVLAIGSVPNKQNAHKWFGKITNQQLFGLTLIAIGLYCYDRWGSRAVRS